MREPSRQHSRAIVYASIDLVKLASILRRRRERYVSPWELARIIPVSTRTAGKLLARMEDLGLVKRYNNRGIYEVNY